MTYPAAPFLAFLLQSNNAIGDAISNGGLPPDFGSYGGITGVFAQFFLVAISMISGVVQNYGLAIILTAALVRLMLLPLTRTQITGMKSMQMLQPVMKEIQRFYPNKQDQSAKTMELYSKYKINPLSGCLPMLVQLPILFGVYRALYDPFFAGKDFLGIQLLFPVNVTSGRSFGLGPELADLVDVTVAEMGLASQLFLIPESIPLIGGSYWYLPGLALVILYVASSLYMQRVMRKVNAPDPEFAEAFKDEMKNRGDEDNKPDMASQMQKQMGFMNFIIIIFAFIFSAGALLYFIVQNTLMVLEYSWIPKLSPQKPLDPKELKAFIRQPPPPAGQQAKPAGKPVEKKEEPAVANPGDDNLEEKSAGDGPEETVAAAPARLSRPRKKRRKR